ncbi:SfnB family sulfur acquisition oxidoreductase [Paenibacillus radicis (ex Xue et al. 2023)]|uniref:SfnB family sulfur acquisition oxidoreductase n=1 Tax=Paenibacillus radicis (ex Xue et al. 2023) TaxID=2972489 RepID=A0ABT1YJ11_9BACL|nr:SfnB family sulfur acquisition oxidoreductase [Paenibacillus radicis (ex Xue et al. 2023)]MCR8633166.1 SfnB family sulfur acquisition oxidoreductase [Paenibacillus radicis (ex Xue et al. 2023)]
MPFEWKTIRYDCLQIPSVWGLALQLGEMQKDLKSLGFRLEPAADLKNGEALEVPPAGEEADIYYSNSLSTLYSLSRGQKIAIVGLNQLTAKAFILVRPDSWIDSIPSLKGATIGVSYDWDNRADIHKIEAIQRVTAIIEQAGLLESDVRWVHLPPGTMNHTQRETVALLQGEVDAIISFGADAYDVERITGARVLDRERLPRWGQKAAISNLDEDMDSASDFDSDSDSEQAGLFAFALSVAWMQSYPEAVERVLAHLQLAAEWADKHQKDAYRHAAKAAGIPESRIETAYDGSLLKQLPLTLDQRHLDLLAKYKSSYLKKELLESDFILDDFVDRKLSANTQVLIASGLVQSPLSDRVSSFMIDDVPVRYFEDRKEARLIRSDEEALYIAHEFADKIRAGASDRDRYRRLPFDEIKQLAESGLLSMVVPQEYGGPGVSTVTLAEVFKIISAADAAIGQIPQNHHFFVKVLELNGTEDQKRHFFAEVLKGAQFGNGLAERGARVGKLMSTRVTSSGEGTWRVNGRKYYCTGSLFSPWIPVFADDDDGKRVAVFIPRQAEGLTLIDDWSGIGQRTTASGSVVLSNVEVPDAYIVPHWKTFEVPQYFGAFAQIMHAAVDVGIAVAAIEDASRFVREKSRPSIQSGAARASEEPYLIKRFGELGVRLQAAEALLEKAAAAIDTARSNLNEKTAGQSSLLVASAKAVATDVVIDITNALFEVAGTASMDEKYNLDRHWRNGRIHTLHDPVRWKLHHVGNWYLNGLLPPNQAGL